MIRTYAVGNVNTASRLDEHGLVNPLWITLTPLGSATALWRDVMCDPINPDKVIIVGALNDGFNIQVSSDAGVTWAVPAGNWDGTTSYHELWYVDTNVIWAVGDSGAVVLSTDAGVTFNHVPTVIGFSVPGDYIWTAGIHALNSLIAVVIGSKSSLKSEQSTYVWKTIDGGTTWNLLNGGLTLPNSSIDPLTGIAYGTAGTAQGIWMSPDEQKIITGTGYAHHLSLDGTAGGYTSTFIDVAQDIHRSGTHLTWFPSYAANPQYFRHTGGSLVSVVTSNDTGLSYTNMRSYDVGDFGIVPLANLPIQISGAHFYSPLNGYYSYHDTGVTFIDHTIDGATTGVLSHTNSVLGSTYESIWTSVEPIPYVLCYELTDCAGILQPIYTQTDLSAEVGLVVTLADSTNHEIKVCWLVTATGVSCPDTVTVSVYRCFDDCDVCLPPTPAVNVPCPRPVNPGYNTGLCDPQIILNVYCSFSDMMYEKMMSTRFNINYCCPPNEVELIIKKEQLDMLLRTGTDPTPDPCNPKCYAYEIDIIGADSAVTSYIDCSEIAQVIITNVDADPLALPRTIGFCALDTTPPMSVVTHPDGTTDTYIIERVSDCVPPWVSPLACIGYNVEMSNGNATTQTFRYIDCNGVEVIITQAERTGIMLYNFCGFEGQIIQRESFFTVEDVFSVTEGPCTGLPPCKQYTVTLNSSDGGTFSYLNCDGVETTQAFTNVYDDQIYIICGTAGQVLTCSACNYFVYVVTGDC